MFYPIDNRIPRKMSVHPRYLQNVGKFKFQLLKQKHGHFLIQDNRN
jgi:hypothetical protein